MRLAGLDGHAGKQRTYTKSADQSALLSAKWNPFEEFDAGGTKVSSATIQRLALGLTFVVNAGAEVVLGTYTGASAGADDIVYADANANTVQKVIDIINGVAPGHPAPGVAGYFTRWRAGLGDFRPGFALGATSGLAVGATSAMLGRRSEGLDILGDTSGLQVANLYSVGIGTGRCREGAGQRFPDNFESEYATDTVGNRFPVRRSARKDEETPGHARYAVYITRINAEMVYASGAKIVSIYDVNNVLRGVFPIGAGTTVPAITEETPFKGPIGSPLFVEVIGTGALTDGPLSVTAEIRIA